MTSAEFAAKYRVLKTITERGARTQIAQESALGRMVMLHHLDVGTAAERKQLVEKLGALSEAASAKVFDVVTIDGVQVIVTHYLATFSDLPSWIDENAVSGDAPTVVIEAMRRPEPAAGGFTSIFGAEKPPEPKPIAPPQVSARPSPAPAAQTPPAAPPTKEPGDFTRVFQGIAPAPPPQPQPAVIPPPAPLASADQGSGFTSVFGKLATPAGAPVQVPSFSSAPPAAPLPPISPRLEQLDSVMPPAPVYAPPPPASSAPAPAAGDFTQLFQRLDPQAATPPTPSYMQAIGGAAAGPSEFTRVLGRVPPPGSNRPPLPPVPNLPTPPVQRPVAPAPVTSPNAEPSAPPARSYLPLIIALNVILIGAIVLVVFLVLKK